MISRLTAATVAAALSAVGLASAASLTSTEEPVLDHHQIEIEQCGDTSDVPVTWSPAPACDDAGLEGAAGSVPTTEAAEPSPTPSPTAPAPTPEPVVPESVVPESETPEPAPPSPQPTSPGSEAGEENPAAGPTEPAPGTGDDDDV